MSSLQGISVDDLKSKLNSASGPKTQATTPDYVKFHDDKVFCMHSSPPANPQIYVPSLCLLA